MNEMTGYDKRKALEFIVKSIGLNSYKTLKPDVSRLITAMIEADISYMHICGALDETGETGEGWYDEDDAFEYVLDVLVKSEKADEEKEQSLAALLNNFYDSQRIYLVKSGLVNMD